MMDTKTVPKSKAFLARIWLFIQGAIVGVAFYIILAFIAYRLYLLTSRPDLINSILGAITLGPGLMFFVFFPGISEELIQPVSGLIFSGLAGMAFGLTGRKWGILLFLVLYIFLTAFLTYVCGLIVTTG